MPTSETSSSGSDRFSSIDALRAVAALYVMAFHFAAVISGAAGDQSNPLRGDLSSTKLLFQLPLMWGYNGVNLFFVISGFCIHAAWARRAARSGNVEIDWAAFTRRRFWRLYPAHAAAIALSVLVLFTWPGKPFPTWQVVGHLLFLQPFSPSLFHGLNPVFWSLGIEIHFYLLYPLFLWLRSKVGIWKVLLLSVAVGLLVNCAFVALFRGDKEALITASNFSLVRWSEWILGCAVAELAYGHHPRIRLNRYWVLGGIAAVPIAMILRAVMPSNFLVPNLLFSLAYAVLVYWTLSSVWPRKSRAVATLAKLGLFSYSLYLTHYCVQPMLQVALQRMSRPLELWERWAFLFSFGAAAALFAWLFYLAFERPFIRAASSGPGTVREMVEPAA